MLHRAMTNRLTTWGCWKSQLSKFIIKLMLSPDLQYFMQSLHKVPPKHKISIQCIVIKS